MSHSRISYIIYHPLVSLPDNIMKFDQTFDFTDFELDSTCFFVFSCCLFNVQPSYSQHLLYIYVPVNVYLLVYFTSLLATSSSTVQCIGYQTQKSPSKWKKIRNNWNPKKYVIAWTLILILRACVIVLFIICRELQESYFHTTCRSWSRFFRLSSTLCYCPWQFLKTFLWNQN